EICPKPRQVATVQWRRYRMSRWAITSVTVGVTSSIVKAGNGADFADVAGDPSLRARIASRVDRVLLRWLALVEMHSLAVHLASGVVLITVANLLIVGLVSARPGLGEGVLLEVMIVLAAAAVPMSLKAISL